MRYLGLIIPVLIFVLVDFLSRTKEKYPLAEKLSNLEKAREAKKAKSILKDFEEINDIDNEEKI